MNPLIDIERNLDPFPIYQQMRGEAPAYYDPDRGTWNIFRYEDVHRVLSDYSTFSSVFMRNSDGKVSSGEPFAASMISTDPPRHNQLRALVTQAFTPRAVEALGPRIRFPGRRAPRRGDG